MLCLSGPPCFACPIPSRLDPSSESVSRPSSWSSCPVLVDQAAFRPCPHPPACPHTPLATLAPCVLGNVGASPRTHSPRRRRTLSRKLTLPRLATHAQRQEGHTCLPAYPCLARPSPARSLTNANHGLVLAARKIKHSWNPSSPLPTKSQHLFLPSCQAKEPTEHPSTPSTTPSQGPRRTAPINYDEILLQILQQGPSHPQGLLLLRRPARVR